MLFIVQLRDAFMDSCFGVMCVTSSGIPIYTKQYWLIRLYVSVACAYVFNCPAPYYLVSPIPR